MANVIKLKTGSSTPTTSDITNLEVAIDKSAAKLYLNDNGTIKEIGGGSGNTLTDGDKGDITVASSGSSWTIDSGVIDNANIASDAAIDGSKISPDFGSQDITTTGDLNCKDLILSDSSPSISFNDSNNNPDYRIVVDSGLFRIQDTTNSNLTIFQINTDGTMYLNKTIEVTGNITVTGTVDGVDIASLNSTVNGKLSNIVDDSSPQLGGNLDMNSKFISSGILGIKNTGSQSELRLYCESNNEHYVAIKAPPHAQFSGNHTFQLPPDGGTNNFVLKTDGSGNTSWVAQTAAYTNNDVDAHLNQSNPTSGYVLSWNGSDYAWVAQSGGGGGISNLVEDTSPQLGGNLDMQSNNITGTGTITATSVASSANGMRKITASTSSPSGGSDGDVWIKYTS